MRTLIKNGTIVNEGQVFIGHIVIVDDRIENLLLASEAPRSDYDEIIDATGCIVFPGVIDTHVHFREPGMTHKADIETESRAAVYGGVTSYFEMPNTVPQTTTIEALHEKQKLAQEKSHVNYSFFFGATNDNVELFKQLDKHRVPGIKLFMGSSTGNMLVDKQQALEAIFKEARQTGLPIMAHCEDTDIINRNMQEAKAKYGDDPEVAIHPYIRSEEACYKSSKKAVELAKASGARFHLAHLSTAKELELLGDAGSVTGEVTVAHLLFSEEDYATLGTRIKCNPAIKSSSDRQALRDAVCDGKISTIGTDHAPHTLEEKSGGAGKAVSGMPMVQFSLIAMLGMVDDGILSLERVTELMCHNPAKLFGVVERGFIRCVTRQTLQ